MAETVTIYPFNTERTYVLTVSWKGFSLFRSTEQEFRRRCQIFEDIWHADSSRSILKTLESPHVCERFNKKWAAHFKLNFGAEPITTIRNAEHAKAFFQVQSDYASQVKVVGLAVQLDAFGRLPNDFAVQVNAEYSPALETMVYEYFTNEIQYLQSLGYR